MRTLIAMLATIILTAPANAQSAADVRAKLKEAMERREKARAKLESNKKYLKENRARAGTIKDEMARLTKERAQLNADLIETSEKVKQTEAKMMAIEGRLGKLEIQEQGLRKSLNAEHRSIGRLLSAINQIGGKPPPVKITGRSDALAMVRSAMLLARAFPKLRGEALALSKQLNRLVALMDEIRKEREQLQAEARTLRHAQSRLASLLKTKRRSLGDRTVELAEVRRTAEVVGDNVDKLEDLTRKLGPAIDRDTRLGRELVTAARRNAKAAAESAAIARRKAQAEKLKKLQPLTTDVLRNEDGTPAYVLKADKLEAERKRREVSKLKRKAARARRYEAELHDTHNGFGTGVVPVPTLTCSGFEPFWQINVSPEGVTHIDINREEKPRKISIAKRSAQTNRNPNYAIYLQLINGDRVILQAKPGCVPDGQDPGDPETKDANYLLTYWAKDGSIVSDCCRPAKSGRK